MEEDRDLFGCYHGKHARHRAGTARRLISLVWVRIVAWLLSCQAVSIQTRPTHDDSLRQK